MIFKKHIFIIKIEYINLIIQKKYYIIIFQN